MGTWPKFLVYGAHNLSFNLSGNWGIRLSIQKILMTVPNSVLLSGPNINIHSVSDRSQYPYYSDPVV